MVFAGLGFPDSLMAWKSKPLEVGVIMKFTRKKQKSFVIQSQKISNSLTAISLAVKNTNSVMRAVSQTETISIE